MPDANEGAGEQQQGEDTQKTEGAGHGAAAGAVQQEEERSLWDDTHPEEQLNRLRVATLALAAALKNTTDTSEVVAVLA